MNRFTHANHHVRFEWGAITSRIDFRIGHFSEESIAGSIISSAIDWVMISAAALRLLFTLYFQCLIAPYILDQALNGIKANS
jgi:hypothetical protein